MTSSGTNTKAAFAQHAVFRNPTQQKNQVAPAARVVAAIAHLPQVHPLLTRLPQARFLLGNTLAELTPPHRLLQKRRSGLPLALPLTQPPLARLPLTMTHLSRLKSMAIELRFPITNHTWSTWQKTVKDAAESDLIDKTKVSEHKTSSRLAHELIARQEARW